MGKSEFDLSEIFSVRKTYLDKSRNYVLRHGNGPFNQGVLAYDALLNIKKYDAMPEEAYSAIKSDADSIDHTEMTGGIHGFLDAVIETGYPGAYWLDAVDGILIEITDMDLVNQETRQKNFLSYQTQYDHAMHIVGRA